MVGQVFSNIYKARINHDDNWDSWYILQIRTRCRRRCGDEERHDWEVNSLKNFADGHTWLFCVFKNTRSTLRSRHWMGIRRVMKLTKFHVNDETLNSRKSVSRTQKHGIASIYCPARTRKILISEILLAVSGRVSYELPRAMRTESWHWACLNDCTRYVLTSPLLHEPNYPMLWHLSYETCWKT